MKRVRVFVSGRVQGVFFRAECDCMARSLGLAGHVRNLTDGRVEVVFEGLDADVDTAVAWCREGPALAAVEGIEATVEPPKGETGFRVR